MEYIDQSVDELRVSLVTGSLNHASLNILKKESARSFFGRVEANIIGASHFCQVRDHRGEDVFAEMVACLEPDSLDKIAWSPKGYREVITRQFNDLDYEIKVEKLNWKTGKNQYQLLIDKVDSANNYDSYGLSFEFPSDENHSFKPLTLVYMKDIRGLGIFSIETLHAYPNENALVFTNSVIKGKNNAIF